MSGEAEGKKRCRERERDWEKKQNEPPWAAEPQSDSVRARSAKLISFEVILGEVGEVGEEMVW